ncbi:MAG: ABC transporter permease [Actinomycetota bacterium]|nr:ABC transporter permease [Actinomycetota bacterium]
MKVLSIAAVNLRRIFRDRVGLFFILVAPVVIILLIGVAIFGQSQRVQIGLLQQGHGPLATEIVTKLEAIDSFKVTRFEDIDSMRKAIRRQNETSGIVIPADYDTKLRNGEQASITFVTDPVRTTQTIARETVNSLVTEQGKVVQAALFAVSTSGQDFNTAISRARTLAASDRSQVRVDPEVIGSRIGSFPTGFGYTAPSNLVLFVFLNSLAAAGMLIESRRLGISRRMLGTPTSTGQILLGEALGRFAIALTQGLIIFTVGAVVFGVNWGQPAAAATLIVLFALVGASAAMLVGTLFRTPEQAASIGVPIGIGLGMLGGCMWPLEIVGPTMKTIGHIFPHAWAMDAWIKLIAEHATFANIWTQLTVLAGFAVVLLPIATWRLRKAIAG